MVMISTTELMGGESKWGPLGDALNAAIATETNAVLAQYVEHHRMMCACTVRQA
jgi:hypothetical protein